MYEYQWFTVRHDERKMLPEGWRVIHVTAQPSGHGITGLVLAEREVPHEDR